MGERPVLTDVFERVLSTFVITVLTAATADGLNWTDLLKVDNWQTWAFAGVAAVFTLLKGMWASRVGRKSASLAPSVGLEPAGK